MLLRSITKHVKGQNWFAVMLDFLIVVAGILLALQITNWNEAKQEEAYRLHLLKSLQSDYQALATELEGLVTSAESKVADAKTLYYLLSGEGPISKEQLGSLPEILWVYNSPPPVSPTYAELFNSGQMQRLKNQKLRNSLLLYARTREYHTEIMTEARTLFTADVAYTHAIELGSMDGPFSEWVHNSFKVAPFENACTKLSLRCLTLLNRNNF